MPKHEKQSNDLYHIFSEWVCVFVFVYQDVCLSRSKVSLPLGALLGIVVTFKDKVYFVNYSAFVICLISVTSLASSTGNLVFFCVVLFLVLALRLRALFQRTYPQHLHDICDIFSWWHWQSHLVEGHCCLHWALSCMRRLWWWMMESVVSVRSTLLARQNIGEVSHSILLLSIFGFLFLSSLQTTARWWLC